MKNHLRRRVGAWLVLILLMQSLAAADQPGPSSWTNADDPFVLMLEGRYREAHRAAENGDVAAYEAVRTQEVVQAMRGYLEKSGKLAEHGPVLKSLSKKDVDLREYVFHRGDRKADTARLIYERLNSKTQLTEYVVIMFRLEGNAWKVGPTGSIQTGGIARTDPAAALVPKPHALSDLLDQEQFQLPK